MDSGLTELNINVIKTPNIKSLILSNVGIVDFITSDVNTLSMINDKNVAMPINKKGEPKQ